MKIKPTFTLPYGYKVHVQVLPVKKFLKAGLPDTCYGAWFSDTQTIVLRGDRADSEIWQDYLHELEHMWVDYRWWLVNQAAPKAG